MVVDFVSLVESVLEDGKQMGNRKTDRRQTADVHGMFPGKYCKRRTMSSRSDPFKQRDEFFELGNSDFDRIVTGRLR